MFPNTMRFNPKAVLLDRDGVINYESKNYILTPEQWRPVPGSLEAIARLTSAAIPVAICSNQSALSRGYFDDATMQAIHNKMITAIEIAGGRISYTAYCPHGPDDDCTCRKPLPGLVHEALEKLGLDAQPHDVMFIGDSLRDVQAAVAAGVRPALVQSGHGDDALIFRESRKLFPSIRAYPDLASIVDEILE